MRLGLMLGYWGLGLTAEDQRALLLEAESAGFDSVWTAEAYGSDAATPLAWFAAQTERIKLGRGDPADPRPLAGHDGDDRRHARPPLQRALPARPRNLRAAGRRGLARAALRQAARAHQGVRGDRAQGARSRAAHLRRRDLHAAAARRARQGAQADDRAGAGADPDLHRRDRPEEHAARRARSPTAGCRSSSRPSTSTTRARCSRRAPRARAARSTASTSPPPCRSRSTTTSTAPAT